MSTTHRYTEQDLELLLQVRNNEASKYTPDPKHPFLYQPESIDTAKIAIPEHRLDAMIFAAKGESPFYKGILDLFELQYLEAMRSGQYTIIGSSKAPINDLPEFQRRYGARREDPDRYFKELGEKVDKARLAILTDPEVGIIRLKNQHYNTPAVQKYNAQKLLQYISKNTKYPFAANMTMNGFQIFGTKGEKIYDSSGNPLPSFPGYRHSKEALLDSLFNVFGQNIGICHDQALALSNLYDAINIKNNPIYISRTSRSGQSYVHAAVRLEIDGKAYIADPTIPQTLSKSELPLSYKKKLKRIFDDQNMLFEEKEYFKLSKHFGITDIAVVNADAQSDYAHHIRDSLLSQQSSNVPPWVQDVVFPKPTTSAEVSSMNPQIAASVAKNRPIIAINAHTSAQEPSHKPSNLTIPNITNSSKTATRSR